MLMNVFSLFLPLGPEASPLGTGEGGGLVFLTSPISVWLSLLGRGWDGYRAARSLLCALGSV